MNDMHRGPAGLHAGYVHGGPAVAPAPGLPWGWQAQMPVMPGPTLQGTPPGFAAYGVPPGAAAMAAPYLVPGGQTIPTSPAYVSAPGVAPPRSGNLLGNPRFVRGAIFGAVAIYLLTNENLQHAAIRSLVRMRSLLQGGVEEMKERFRDAEAELHAAQAHD